MSADRSVILFIHKYVWVWYVPGFPHSNRIVTGKCILAHCVMELEKPLLKVGKIRNRLSEVFICTKIQTKIFFDFCHECWYRLGVLAELSWAQLRNKQITCVQNELNFSSGQKYKNIFVHFLCKWRLRLNHFGFYWPLRRTHVNFASFQFQANQTAAKAHLKGKEASHIRRECPHPHVTALELW